MEITKEKLLKDEAGIKDQREQLLAQINFLSGALQYIADKLKEIEEQEGKVNSND